MGRSSNRLQRFLSTLSLRRATGHGYTGHRRVLISIHALLAESDQPAADIRHCGSTISIHALLAESDSGSVPRCAWHDLFLSTLSLRRATAVPEHVIVEHFGFLSTLSLRRATGPELRQFFGPLISIHALLAESDFNGDHGHMSGDISIHALLAESDLTTVLH